MLQPAVRCVEFVESVTDWMEGALTEEERLELEEHLAICPHCTEYVDQIRLTRAVLRGADDTATRESPPPAARAALLTAFRRERDERSGR